ncbi:potassium-transporting ATPase subunit KdpC [Trichlorobacter ammonificans]|uniref:Potassium-transporting ATPase KdpC subunit n=1 Tax=Trichlorobacter ammonificans TaxID=2916410 RepID=A0ABM9DCY1_9BACT|nr:potassium-transporting ATPase subunit KdpC [Trichlorobacter ammonificans]CAH2032311.1 K(+) transporting P-type ATPase subunit KdpC [Trichlorobacter ammonificans]
MNDLKAAILLFITFTVICGGIYPLAVTGIAQAVFPRQANGSFISGKDGKEIGSVLIGQPFSDPQYFWPRPSATAEFGYNPAASGGSNAGPTNPDYLKIVAGRVADLRAGGITGPIPADLAQASASGIDPHISVASARLQIPRVARSRGLSEDAVAALVARTTEGRQFGLLGEPRVNVLVLNLNLATLQP